MNKEICYKNPEGQEFQAKPHISLMHSQDSIVLWRVDLKWREDSNDSRIDAELTFEDKMDFRTAKKHALELGKALNVPVAEYGITIMWRLQKADAGPDEDREKRLKILMSLGTVKKFLTH
jgi:hypothetical protein